MFEPGQYASALEPLLGKAAGYARALLRNKQDAEDAVQEAALRGWQRIGTFDASRPFKGWWFTILRNCCIDIMRRSKTTATHRFGDHDPPQTIHQEPEDWVCLAAGIEALSEKHREVLQLRYFGDLSYDDLAQTLNIPRGTVMSRLYFARKALAAHLREDLR